MEKLSQNTFNSIISQFESLNPIMVLGDIGIDKYTFGDVARISPEAPVPILQVTKEWFQLGLAANVASNLNGLNIKSTLYGIQGVDNHAETIDQLLREKPLIANATLKDKEHNTIVKERILTKVQQICRIDYESKKNISKKITKEITKNITAKIPTHSALIIEDYGKGLLTGELLSYVIKSFKEAGKLICVDPGRVTPPHYYTGCTLLKPNWDEAQIMTKFFGYNETDLKTMMEILMDKLQLEKIIITLGSKGMALMDTNENSQLIMIPTLASEVYDVSGAGDTVISVITASLCTKCTLSEAAWLGNCAASVVVSKKGTVAISAHELNNHFNALQSASL